jgi:hypothetical protein
MLRSTAVVLTDAPARYAKQLVSHLSGKSTITVESVDGQPEARRLVFSYGWGVLSPESDRLVMHAAAEDAESLARLQDVLARHLERFGARRQLSVSWQASE